MLPIGSFERKRKGQTSCDRCKKNYNNACIPAVCECGYQIGGGFQPKTKKQRKHLDTAKLITADLVSVRLNKRGTNVRAFADLAENKVI